MNPPVAVGIIHARGGSRRVPLKNLKPLGGKPLVAWIIEAARAARALSRVIMSTDHDEIARVALEYGAEVPFRRPPDLSEDVPSEQVTQHAIRFLDESGYRIDVAVTLQPTTPFTSGADIDACVEKLIATGADSVITVGPARERPEWMMRLGERDRLIPLQGWWRGEQGVSQSLPSLYLPNGGVYATRRDVLMIQDRIIGEDTRAVVMPMERSVDIDEAVDFVIAEAILAGRSQKNERACEA